jgi:hypothetical protein
MLQWLVSPPGTSDKMGDRCGNNARYNKALPAIGWLVVY